MRCGGKWQLSTPAGKTTVVDSLFLFVDEKNRQRQMPAMRWLVRRMSEQWNTTIMIWSRNKIARKRLVLPQQEKERTVRHAFFVAQQLLQEKVDARELMAKLTHEKWKAVYDFAFRYDIPSVRSCAERGCTSKKAFQLVSI
jgi:hypothetical protein